MEIMVTKIISFALTEFSVRAHGGQILFWRNEHNTSAIYSVMLPAIKQNRFLKVHLIITRERETRRVSCPKEVPTYHKNS